MTAPRSRSGRQVWAAVRLMLAATVVLGLLYPLVITGIAQVIAPGGADGSLVHAGGRVVGSALIGQGFTDSQGNPLPQYFQSRPSASGYDGKASGGTNLGPNSARLAQQIQDRRAAVAAFDGVAPTDVPPDAVTASASGLDPGISPAYAAIQVDRVARERGVSAERVTALVGRATGGRDAGFVGAPFVNVLELNLALDRAFP
jgi:potassium-transporting ATPase KdpC subunit